jgi:hypothetical protein
LLYFDFRNGYATTAKEKELNDKLQQKNEEAMSNYMKKLVKTPGPTSTSTNNNNDAKQQK